MKVSLNPLLKLDLGETLNPIRFTALFVSTLLSLIIYPFVDQGHEIILGFAISIILLAAIFSVSANKKHLIIAIILGIPSIFLAFLDERLFDQNFLLFSCLLRFVFFTYIISIYLLYILGSYRITKDTLFGAISIYLLMGLAWMHLYSALEILSPESFQGMNQGAQGYSHDLLGNFMYFSYVTLSTLGYGDLIPISLPAKIFSALEAISGQLYLAILIARLIGLHLVGRPFPQGAKHDK